MERSLDIIIPVFNPPADWIEKFIGSTKELNATLSDYSVNYIVVNDGSSIHFDKSSDLILKSEISRIQIIHQSENLGKGAAVRAGFAASTSELSMFTDVDFPYSSESIKNLLSKLEAGNDIACGSRQTHYYGKIPFQRKIVSLVFRFVNRILFGLKISDTQCGLKAFRPKGAQVLLKTRINHFLFDLEMLIIASQNKLKITTVPVEMREGIQLYPLSIPTLLREAFNFTHVLMDRFGSRLRNIAFLGFSFWLMWRSFSYDSKTKVLEISAKVWSDFASHIPLIRSFSLGDNWPPQYPIYSGPPIKYHFFYYWFVGKLEKIGFNLDWALNLPSAIGYFLILLGIYGLAKHYTGSRRVGTLSILFFIFDGSFGWIQYFTKHGWSLETIKGIPFAREFVAMGPWDSGNVLAFWHINTYTNQRHFSFALGIAFAAMLFFEKYDQQKKYIQWVGAGAIGLIFGLMPQLHKPVLVIMCFSFLYLFLFRAPSRPGLWIVALFAALSAAFVYTLNLNYAVGTNQSIATWYPGFAIHDHLTAWEFVKFWTWNFGLHFVFAAASIALAPKALRRALLPSLGLFVAGFFFRYSSDVLVNHKFFNFIQIFLGICTANMLIIIWDHTKNRFHNNNLLKFSIVTLVLLPFVLSGIINLFAVMNDDKFNYADVGSDPTSTWIYNNSSPKDVFIPQQYLYDPASMAGRSIYLGWAYFVSSEGWDWDARRLIMQKIFTTNDKSVICYLLRENNISFVELGAKPSESLMIEAEATTFANLFKPIYESPNGFPKIYKYSNICTN